MQLRAVCHLGRFDSGRLGGAGCLIEAKTSGKNALIHSHRRPKHCTDKSHRAQKDGATTHCIAAVHAASPLRYVHSEWPQNEMI